MNTMKVMLVAVALVGAAAVHAQAPAQPTAQASAPETKSMSGMSILGNQEAPTSSCASSSITGFVLEQ
jgi:hypothetical protein